MKITANARIQIFWNLISCWTQSTNSVAFEMSKQVQVLIANYGKIDKIPVGRGSLCFFFCFWDFEEFRLSVFLLKIFVTFFHPAQNQNRLPCQWIDRNRTRSGCRINVTETIGGKHLIPVYHQKQSKFRIHLIHCLRMCSQIKIIAVCVQCHCDCHRMNSIYVTFYKRKYSCSTNNYDRYVAFHPIAIGRNVSIWSL